jgi:hypothetical protein
MSGAAGNGLCTTIKYLRGAAGIDLGTSAKYLRGAARERFCRGSVQARSCLFGYTIPICNESKQAHCA